MTTAIAPRSRAASGALPTATEANKKSTFSSDRAKSSDEESNDRVAGLLSNSRFGIDMVAVSLPVSPDLCDLTHESWSPTTVRNAGTERETSYREAKVEGCPSVYVRLTEHPVWQARVEFNPARLVDPEGAGLCSAMLLQPVVGRVLSSDALRPLAPHKDLLTRDGEVLPELSDEVVAGLPLKRLDVSLDLVVEDTGVWMHRLLTVPAKHMKSSRKPAGSVGNQGTVYVGNQREFFRIYDKNRESKGVAPAGTLRVELQMRREWLKAHDLLTLGQATPERLAGAFVSKWGRANFDTPLNLGSTSDTIFSACPPLLAQRLLGVVVRAAEGKDPRLTDSQRKTYQKDLDRLGIVLGEPLKATGAAVKWLDVSTGHERRSVSPPVA